MRSSSCSSWVNLTASCCLVLTLFGSPLMVLSNPHGPIHHDRIIHNDDQPTFLPAETIPHVPDLRPMTRGINPTSHRGPHQVNLDQEGSVIRPGRQVRFPEEERCPTDSSCINYRSCVRGVISRTPPVESETVNPSLEELREFGTPCGKPGNGVCCKRAQSPPAGRQIEDEFFNLNIENLQCPNGFGCVNFRFCDANAFISDLPSGLFGPSVQELMELGARPCGSSGQEVCCRRRFSLSQQQLETTTPPISIVNAIIVDTTCPTGNICISYRFCNNGIVSSTPTAGIDAVGPSLQELMEFGKPCGNSGREVCCSRTPKATQMDSIPVILSPLPPSPLLLEGIPESSIIAAISNDLVGCPADSSCINYRFCANGFITDIPSGFDEVGPSILELAEFGTPCGSAEVCCRRVPTLKPTETTVATLPTLLPPTETPILSFFEADSTTMFPEINETCPAGMNCISYRWCANGVVTDLKSGFDLIGPSFEELQEFGRPCGSFEVCCLGTPPVETIPTEGNTNPTTETSTAISTESTTVVSTQSTTSTTAVSMPSITSTEPTPSTTTLPVLGGTCPVGLSCISYRWCANGVVTDFKSGFDPIGPSLDELQEFGLPCGQAEVCCQGTPPEETVIPTEANFLRTTSEMSIPTSPIQTSTIASTEAITTSTTSETSRLPSTQPSVITSTEAITTSSTSETSRPPSMQPSIITTTEATRTTSTETIIRIPSTEMSQIPSTSTVITSTLASTTEAASTSIMTTPASTAIVPTFPTTKSSASPNNNHLFQFHHYPKPLIFRPSNAKPSAVATARPGCGHRHHHSNHGAVSSSPPKLVPQTFPVNSNKAVGFIVPQDLKLTHERPYQSCASDLYTCVPKDFCNLAGITVNTPLNIPNSWQQYRLPLTSCWNSKIKQGGVCCRDAYRMNSWPGVQRPWPVPLMFRKSGYSTYYNSG